jgi:ABC-type transport system involved in multi-copper enzyme maturation permease subunit
VSEVALHMYRADLLKLRKKRGTLIWALVLALAPVVVFFVVKAVQHSSNAVKYEPAGGIEGYRDGLRAVAVFFGPLAAILIGVEAGAGDVSAGVFRDLVVTGRSRAALFASRVPAALTLCWAVVLGAFALLLLGTYALASGRPTPDAALVFNGLGFTLLSTGVICAVAVGFASLTASKAASITALIGWQLVASPLISQIGSLASTRRGLLSESVEHFSPVDVGGHGASVFVPSATALVVIVAWLVLFVGLGAWRTRQMDA